MKNVLENKKLILLDEYKEGFGEIAKLVNEFEGISTDSQETYMRYMELCLYDQLDMVDKKKTELINEAKEFLARYNSQFKAFLDTEKHLNKQLEYYRAQRKVITNENTNETITEEKAAV